MHSPSLRRFDTVRCTGCPTRGVVTRTTVIRGTKCVLVAWSDGRGCKGDSHAGVESAGTSGLIGALSLLAYGIRHRPPRLGTTH